LLPVGGIAIVPALVWMVVVTGAATPVALLAQRRMDRERRAAHDAEQEPSPSAE
jgi:hypothetical protein